MRTRNGDLLVGIFVIMTIGALCFLAIKASGLSSEMSGGSTYTLKAHFENIGGLTDKAKVTMSGVQIGRVASIELDPKRLDALVTLKIDSDVNTIDEGSTASILTSGLLGEKYIGITVGAEERILKDGDTIDQTQSALVLEELIGKFLFNKTQSAPAAAAPAATTEPAAESAF